MRKKADEENVGKGEEEEEVEEEEEERLGETWSSAEDFDRKMGNRSSLPV